MLRRVKGSKSPKLVKTFVPSGTACDTILHGTQFVFSGTLGELCCCLVTLVSIVQIKLIGPSNIASLLVVCVCSSRMLCSVKTLQCKALACVTWHSWHAGDGCSEQVAGMDNSSHAYKRRGAKQGAEDHKLCIGAHGEYVCGTCLQLIGAMSRSRMNQYAMSPSGLKAADWDNEQKCMERAMSSSVKPDMELIFSMWSP